MRGGGTDSNVFLKIYGTKHDTDRIALKSSEGGGNKFERGRTDVFKLDSTDVGKVIYSIHFCFNFKS